MDDETIESLAKVQCSIFSIEQQSIVLLLHAAKQEAETNDVDR